MKFSIDECLRQKIGICIDDAKIFYFDFPSTSKIEELHEVVSELKIALWNTMEAEKKANEENKIVEMPTEEICCEICSEEEPK
jgi:hypothetical protein